MQPKTDFQGIKGGREPLLLSYRGMAPAIDSTAWVAPTSVVVGDVVIGAESSIWFHCVVRGDVQSIRIGSRVNIQDGAVCHVQIGNAPLTIDDSASIGHGAILHGCSIRSGTLIGIGARVLDHAVIESESLIAAGSVVREGTLVPSGQLWAGVPAVFKRELSREERASIWHTAERYVAYRLHYMGEDAEIRPEILPRRKD